MYLHLSPRTHVFSPLFMSCLKKEICFLPFLVLLALPLSFIINLLDIYRHTLPYLTQHVLLILMPFYLIILCTLRLLLF